jgi:hypothetical protein
VDGNGAFDLDESRSLYQRLGLRIDCIRRIGFTNGGHWLCPLLLLAFGFDIVELDVSSDDASMGSVIGSLLLQFLLELIVFLFVRRRDDAPAASPWHTGSKSDPDPRFHLNLGPLHHDVDIVEILGPASNQSASVGLLKGRVLVHGQSNSGCPLYKRLVGSEVQQVSVPASGGKA